MPFTIETRLDDEKDWYVVIDPDTSRVLPVQRTFNTEEEAEKWARANLDKVDESNWRVSDAAE